MTSIDELGRAAGRSAVAEMERMVDADSMLRRVLAAADPSVRPSRARRRWAALAGVAVATAATVVAVAVVAREEPPRVGTAVPPAVSPEELEPTVPASTDVAPTQAPPPEVTSGTVPPTDAAVETTAETVESTTTQPAVASPLLTVHPFGGGQGPFGFRVLESNAVVSVSTGEPDELVLTYELAVSTFVPDVTDGTLTIEPATDDRQLAVTVRCKTDPCRMVRPQDEAGDPLLVEVRTTDVPLEPGIHLVRGHILYSDSTTTDLAFRLLANPSPDARIAQEVADWDGDPKVVQRVLDVGKFGYNLTSAFGSIWVVNTVSDDVARIDATTGALLATVPVGAAPTRITATDDAIFVGGASVTRIDPTTNVATMIGTAGHAAGIISDGESVLAAGHDFVQRIEASGAVVDVPAPDGSWFEAAISGGLVWLLEAGSSRLIAVDPATGELRHQVDVAIGISGATLRAVRLVADETSVVVGIDTSGGGRTGELVLVDPVAGAITGRVELGSRPEGIALTVDRIWTSGAVVDRRTLGVRSYGIGFSLTVGPDGSIWGVGGRAASGYSTADVTRHAPGQPRDGAVRAVDAAGRRRPLVRHHRHRRLRALRRPPARRVHGRR